jgi:hypothetical protein
MLPQTSHKNSPVGNTYLFLGMLFTNEFPPSTITYV